MSQRLFLPSASCVPFSPPTVPVSASHSSGCMSCDSRPPTTAVCGWDDAACLHVTFANIFELKNLSNATHLERVEATLLAGIQVPSFTAITQC